MAYTFKTRPFDHQRTALKRAMGRAGYAYLMEMGTGKTKVIIDEAGILFDNREIDTMVVFAPKGVYRNWVRELEIHMGVPYVVEYWVAGGGNKAQQRALEKILSPRPHVLRILLVNIEAMSTTGIATRYVEKFIGSGRCYAAVDESTKIKSPTSACTKNITKMCRGCYRRRIATGSPAPNSPLDLFSQFEFLAPGLIGSTSYHNFKARYAVTQKKEFKVKKNGVPITNRDGTEKTNKVDVIVGYKNVPDLTQRVGAHSYRVLKEECMDLPPKVYRMADVDLTDQQATMYAAMRDEAFVEFAGGFTSSQSSIVTLMRLQQILAGHIKDADGNMHRIPSNRVETLLEQMEGMSGAAIIWSRFRPEVEDIVGAIRANYGEESVAQFHGGNTNTRVEESLRFVNSDRCRFMVSTQQSGAFGNTWLKGTNTFYSSNSFNLEHRLQSEDRPHRGGQTQKCTYTDLVAEGTIDMKLIRALRAKINIAETIMDDDPREWLI